jgi:N-methylhydantoinase B
MSINKIDLEVFRHLFAGVAEEMGLVLGRCASSVNIKERRDYSCAVFDGKGRMISQAAHIPVHLGSMPLSVEAALRSGALEGGRPVVLNDPFRGGTHLPDVTLVVPVGAGRRRDFIVACRAHYSDIGGMSPGSMPVSTDLYQEGLIMPPLPLTAEVRALLLANVRTPRDVEGDLAAQEACCEAGVRRLRELGSRHGPRLLEAARATQAYSRRHMEAALRRIPSGRYRFTDELDDDGVSGRPVKIRVCIERRGRRVLVDFAGTDPQTPGNVNCVRAVTLSATLYVFRCLVPEDIPLNAGAAAPILLRTPRGSVVDALPPAAVTAGNVETSQRIVDALLGALRRARPDLIPAASQGTMNNLSFGGMHQGRPFAYYETIAGGMGARPTRDGVSGVHTHMTNTLNTPIEAFELAYPVRLSEYRLRRGSGGRGRRHRGGEGIVRALEFLAPAQVSLITERRRSRPWGDPPGKPGRNTLNGRPLPGKAAFGVKPGDRVRIQTPGGGGL